MIDSLCRRKRLRLCIRHGLFDPMICRRLDAMILCCNDTIRENQAIISITIHCLYRCASYRVVLGIIWSFRLHLVYRSTHSSGSVLVQHAPYCSYILIPRNRRQAGVNASQWSRRLSLTIPTGLSSIIFIFLLTFTFILVLSILLPVRSVLLSVDQSPWSDVAG